MQENNNFTDSTAIKERRDAKTKVKTDVREATKYEEQMKSRDGKNVLSTATSLKTSSTEQEKKNGINRDHIKGRQEEFLVGNNKGQQE